MLRNPPIAGIVHHVFFIDRIAGRERRQRVPKILCIKLHRSDAAVGMEGPQLQYLRTMGQIGSCETLDVLCT